jgi:hypothetical protein
VFYPDRFLQVFFYFFEVVCTYTVQLRFLQYEFAPYLCACGEAAVGVLAALQLLFLHLLLSLLVLVESVADLYNKAAKLFLLK